MLIDHYQGEVALVIQEKNSVKQIQKIYFTPGEKVKKCVAVQSWATRWPPQLAQKDQSIFKVAVPDEKFQATVQTVLSGHPVFPVGNHIQVTL